MDDIMILGSAFSIFSIVLILGLILTKDRYNSEKKDEDNIRMQRTQSLSILIDDSERDTSEYVSERQIHCLRKINEDNRISKNWVNSLINKRGGRSVLVHIVTAIRFISSKIYWLMMANTVQVPVKVKHVSI